VCPTLIKSTPGFNKIAKNQMAKNLEKSYVMDNLMTGFYLLCLKQVKENYKCRQMTLLHRHLDSTSTERNCRHHFHRKEKLRYFWKQKHEAMFC
jgi:hypothetical protein